MEDRVILEVEINDKTGKPSDKPGSTSSSSDSSSGPESRPKREWPGLGGSDSSPGPSVGAGRRRRPYDALPVPEAGDVFGAAAQGGFEGFMGARGGVINRLRAGGSAASNAAGAAAVGGGASALAALGAVAATAAVGIVAATSAVWAFTEGMKAATDAARFSPDAQAAQQLNELNKTLGIMAQAREIGPLLGSTSMAQAELTEEIRALKTELLKILLPIVNLGTDVSADIIELLTNILALMNAVNSGLGGAFGKWLGVQFPALMGLIRTYIANQEKDRDDFKQEWLNELNDFLEPKKN